LLQVSYYSSVTNAVFNSYEARDIPIRDTTDGLKPLDVAYMLSLMSIDDFEVNEGYANVVFDIWVNQVSFCRYFNLSSSLFVA
jgi:hypothetical protein